MNILLILLINLIAGIVVMILHELAKNIAAFFLTHPVYRQGVKINSPLKYIDVLGAIMFAFSWIATGWQRPVKYDYKKFRMEESGLVVLAVVGQVASLVFAIVLLPIVKYLQVSMPLEIGLHTYIYLFLYNLITFNLSIFFVNLLPILPFDMSLIVQGLSAEKYAYLVRNDMYLKLFFLFIIGSGMIPKIVNFFLAQML